MSENNSVIRTIENQSDYPLASTPFNQTTRSRLPALPESPVGEGAKSLLGINFGGEQVKVEEQSEESQSVPRSEKNSKKVRFDKKGEKSPQPESLPTQGASLGLSLSEESSSSDEESTWVPRAPKEVRRFFESLIASPKSSLSIYKTPAAQRDMNTSLIDVPVDQTADAVKWL